jgi:hypothetical protein
MAFSPRLLASTKLHVLNSLSYRSSTNISSLKYILVETGIVHFSLLAEKGHAQCRDQYASDSANRPSLRRSDNHDELKQVAKIPFM